MLVVSQPIGYLNYIVAYRLVELAKNNTLPSGLCIRIALKGCQTVLNGALLPLTSLLCAQPVCAILGMGSDQIRSDYISSSHTRLIRCLTH